MPEIMRSSRQLRPFATGTDIGSKLTPGLDLIWTNKKTPQQALDELEPIIQPLLQGVYPDE